jgi:Ca2+:H+ antiporter
VRRLYALAVFIPVALALDLANASPAAVFFTAALAIVPTAVLMSDATEHLAARSGPGIGGLLNVTFGNAPELIIAAFALEKGLHEVVKASLVGSVIGNSLLVLGFAMVAGGWRRERQHFSREATDRISTLLLVAAFALVVPTIVLLLTGHGHLPGVNEERHDYSGLIEIVSIVVGAGLLGRYSIGLVLAVRGRRGLFDMTPDAEPPEDTWTVRRSVLLLALAGVAVGGMSEVLVGSIEEASHSIGLSPFFVAVFVVGIAGNAAEHWVAVVVAVKDKMDLSLSIALGSSVQIAMFLVPVLVFLSFVLGPHPMALAFNGYEIAALLSAAVIARIVTAGGQSTRAEGLFLLAVYAALGVVFLLA